MALNPADASDDDWNAFAARCSLLNRDLVIVSCEGDRLSACSDVLGGGWFFGNTTHLKLRNRDSLSSSGPCEVDLSDFPTRDLQRLIDFHYGKSVEVGALDEFGDLLTLANYLLDSRFAKFLIEKLYSQVNQDSFDELFPFILRAITTSSHINQDFPLFGQGFITCLSTKWKKYVSKQSIAILAQLAMQGSALGFCCLGICYQVGAGVPIDRKQAFEMYQRALDFGDPLGSCALGRLYQEEGELERAAQAFKLAADQNHPLGLYYVGACLRDGLGVAQDGEAAVRCFQKIPPHLAIGHFMMGQCFERGLGVALDMNMAIVNYLRAARLGSSQAIARLSGLYLAKSSKFRDPNKGHELLQELRRFPAAMAYLGQIYQFGYDVVAPDMAQAFQLYGQAAALGNPDGLVALGQCYQFGYGVRVDLSRAIELYEEASLQNNPVAHFHLGQHYHSLGQISEARKYYLKAARENFIEAKERLQALTELD
jgi:TPR repeat protein